MKCIDDFHTFLASIKDQDIASRHRFEFKPRDSEASLKLLANRVRFPVPDAFATLLIQEGAFQNTLFAYVWQTLRLFSATELLELPTGLIEAIHYHWSGRPELDEWFSSETRLRIDTTTVLFGLRYEDDDVHDYYFFDASGRFDHVCFNQDNPEAAKLKLEALIRNPGPGLAFELLIEDQLQTIRSAIASEV